MCQFFDLPIHSSDTKIVQNLVVGYNPDGKNGNLVVFCFASEVKHAEPSVFVNLKMVGRFNHVTKPEVK